ncbi:MAG: hypothetical protein K8T25_09830 [Planctomycetia bacterium]|nr:hypothetical protein [Planctomycetia bacterium]
MECLLMITAAGLIAGNVLGSVAVAAPVRHATSLRAAMAARSAAVRLASPVQSGRQDNPSSGQALSTQALSDAAALCHGDSRQDLSDIGLAYAPVEAASGAELERRPTSTQSPTELVGASSMSEAGSGTFAPGDCIEPSNFEPDSPLAIELQRGSDGSSGRAGLDFIFTPLTDQSLDRFAGGAAPVGGLAVSDQAIQVAPLNQGVTTNRDSAASSTTAAVSSTTPAERDGDAAQEPDSAPRSASMLLVIGALGALVPAGLMGLYVTNRRTVRPLRRAYV